MCICFHMLAHGYENAKDCLINFLKDNPCVIIYLSYEIYYIKSGWVVTWFLLGYTVRKNGGLLSTPMF